MRTLILYFVLTCALFAQYDSTMYDLIKTTYERSFDKQIIHNYLNSDLEHNTKAALLSISQSEDTLFVPELLKLYLMKYGSEVCFALAQIGKCNQSINFLWNYLLSTPPQNQYPKIFFAIGKIGDDNDLKKLVEFYNSFDGPIFPYEGISEAILQFQIRGLTSDDAKAILENEIVHQLSTSIRIEQALFALARYRNSSLTDQQLQNLFQTVYVDNDGLANETALKQYLLLNIIRDWNADKSNLFINNVNDLRNTLLNINFVKVLHHFHYFMKSYPEENIKVYFDLLNDKNPNVALQTAISIKNIKDYLNDSLKIEVKNKIDSLLYDSTKSLNFKGELFLSRFELFGNYDEHMDLFGHGVCIDPNHFLVFNMRSFGSYLPQKKLIEYFLISSDFISRIKAFEELIENKNKIKDSLDYKKIILLALKSYPALTSLASDQIDSIFIANNQNELKEIITSKIKNHKDDTNYLEATMSLINLAEKIDNDFYTSMIEKVKSSKLYSIRKFVGAKTGDKQIGLKELDKFEDIWGYAFRYKQATIKTSKGNIVIAFDSGIAPISVANFCMLADKNFYDGIIFHRVVPGFVIQAGDPTGTGWGGPGYDVVSEFSDTDFGIGYVGMASAGKDTESSQFFIMQGSYPHLDSRYTLFAKVIDGMDVVYNITEDDKIISIKLEK